MPPKVSALDEGKKSVRLTDTERKLLGISSQDDDDDDVYAHVGLKYYNPSVECFSEWDKSELRGFSGFIQQVNGRTWAMIYKSAGRARDKLGNGLAYTPHKKPEKLPGYKELIGQINEDITFFELRVTGEARVHGFRALSTFFLVCLDKDHRFHPM